MKPEFLGKGANIVSTQIKSFFDPHIERVRNLIPSLLIDRNEKK